MSSEEKANQAERWVFVQVPACGKLVLPREFMSFLQYASDRHQAKLMDGASPLPPGRGEANLLLNIRRADSVGAVTIRRLDRRAQ